MPTIVNTTLHPEDDATVDLYPKTSSEQVSDFLDKTFPVGTILHRYDNTSPASLFGGTWTKITTGYLISHGYGSLDLGDTTGSSTHIHGTPTGNNGNLAVNCQISQTGTGQILYSLIAKASHTAYQKATFNSISGITAETNSITTGWAVIGETSSGNNLPPSVCVYIWRRVS